MPARAWGLIGPQRPRAPRAERRTRAAAIAVGLLSQTVLWATYYYVTNGCMCSVDGAPEPATSAWIYPTLLVTSAPAQWLPLVLPVPYVTGTLLNLAAWTVAAYTVLKAAQVLARSASMLRARPPRPHGRP
jgi:hypothetical protein